MNELSPQPPFSVIMPTRNRASQFAVALRSVLDQRFPNFEVIVVDDGSSEEQTPHYRDILAAVSDRARLLTLVRTEHGHGQSYALNFGAAHAYGNYLCFLDDDDQWTDPEHLGRTAVVIAACPKRIDLVLANQKAYRNGTPTDRVVWIEDLRDHLNNAPDAAAATRNGGGTTALPGPLPPEHHHRVARILPGDRRLDEGLRYECDRDFYLRAIDRPADQVLACTVSRHNIPDPAAAEACRRGIGNVEAPVSATGMDKAVLFAAHPELRRYAMRHRLYVLEHIALEACGQGAMTVQPITGGKH